MKATSGDIEFNRSMKGVVNGLGVSEGDLFDIFFGPQK